MNILIPHSWLLEHLETDATPTQIAENISLCGPTIEHITQWPRPFTGSKNDLVANDQRLRTGHEVIYDIEVTTNRVDAMSIRGIAREAAAILPQFNIPATLKPLRLSTIKPGNNETIKLEIHNDPQLCHRIMAVKLSNIQLAPSPQWLQDRLSQIGQRPLNNAIDITNYVMFEIGHPIHAFDYDKVTATGKLIVREAKPGETFTTLDNKVYTTVGGEVVFDDGNGTIIDLPGIMGTANTVVTNQTQNILLWIESIDPAKIRHASIAHQIRSQAAILNEKNVDPYLADQALERAIQLYQEICPAQVASSIYDDFPVKPEIKSIDINHQLIESYLGTSLNSDNIVNILKDLGCEAQLDTKNLKPETTSNLDVTYTITPPSYRAHDLQEKVDFIEEIARIYGYHKLPSQLMATPIPNRTNWHDPQIVDYRFEHQLKHLLSGFGITEVYTYSLISAQLAEQFAPLDQHLVLSNPLSEDNVYLRRSHIPSHLQFLDDNPQHRNFTIFELANIYNPQDKQLPHESLILTLTSNQDYSTFKGYLVALMNKLHIDHRITQKSSDSALIVQFPTESGAGAAPILGEIKISRKNNAIYHAIINISAIQELARFYPNYKPLPKFPPIIQDFTLKFPTEIKVGDLIETIKANDSLVRQVDYLDSYKQNHTFRIYFQHPEQNLTDQDIQPIRDKIASQLAQKFQAELVS